MHLLEPIVLPLLLFVTLSLLAAAVLLAVRDMVFRRRALVDQRSEGGAFTFDMETRKGPSYAWLRGLTTVGDVGITPEAIPFWAVALGFATGAAVMLWRDDVLSAVGSTLVAVLVVWGILAFLRARRRREILDQLPDVVDFLARAVRSGASVDQGIQMVGRSAFRPLAAEFARCSGQLELGLSLDAVMQTLTRRVPLVETRILAATLRVQRQTGGNLPFTLERLAHVFRDRLNYYRQFRAVTATSRASAVLLIVLAAVVDAYVLLGRPDYARQILDTPAGWTLVAVSLGLQVVGLLWIVLTLRADY